MSMGRISKRARTASYLVFVALAIAVTASTPASAAPPASAKLINCPPPHYPGVGYFTSLTASGTTCATGNKVAIAYYHCRVRNGLKGRCEHGVLGFRCTEKRVSIPTEIDARVTCLKGKEKVVHTYQQDT
jgi:hypothetical protein